MRSQWLWLFALLACALEAQGQKIVDDTTKLVDGFNKTIYVHPEQLMAGKVQGRKLDSSLAGFQETDEWLYMNGERQKNLGYIGSPQSAMFYQHGLQIGRSLGLDATKYLTYQPDSVRFYRNYNVYSRVRYNQGSFGRQWIEVEAAKNIAKNFNIGFSLRRLTAQKQIGVSTFREKGADQTAYTLHFNGSLLNNHYLLLGSLSNFKQTLTETGGILANDSTPQENLYDFDVASTQFATSGSSVERRRNFRLHNIIRIDTGLPHLVVTAGFDVYRYQFSVRGKGLNPNIAYRDYFLNSDTTNNDYQYEQIFVNPRLVQTIGPVQLQVGANIRRHLYANQKLEINRINETIYYGQGSFEIDLGRITLNAASVPGRDHSLSAELRTPWFYAMLTQAAISPTFVAQNLTSNHFLWRNNFSLEQVLHAEAGIFGAGKYFQGSVSVRNQTIKNGIFYTDAVNPRQEGGRVNTLSIKAYGRLSVGKFSWDVHAQGANPNRQDLLPQPKYFVRSSPSFLFRFKGGRYQVNPGLDVWYRSAFNGQAYDPSTGLFYLQGQAGGLNSGFPKQQTLDPYLWTCVFVNIKINNTRGYIKLGNATQDLIGKGFFDVPFYPGQRRYFEFGVDWIFFD